MGARDGAVSCCALAGWAVGDTHNTQPFHLCCPPHTHTQAAQRGVKQAAPTQPDPEDPCAAHYGDYPMVQSTQVTQRKWTRVEQLTPALQGQKVRQTGFLGGFMVAVVWCSSTSSQQCCVHAVR